MYLSRLSRSNKVIPEFQREAFNRYAEAPNEVCCSKTFQDRRIHPPENSGRRYAVAGAIDKDEYVGIIEHAGFVDVTIQKEKQITVPDEILLNFLSESELKSFKDAGTGIYSITIYGKKSKGCGCGCNC